MQQSPIFSKTYDLLAWLIPATTKFPREQRFVLARHVQETALRFQEELIEAAAGPKNARELALAGADVSLTKLRFYLRLCQDLHLLTPRQYRHVAEMVAEIGRLLGGWRQKTGTA
ncbi:MAG: diversity-generating retroelement protein Avd [Chloroflexi bacterium]|nr:diversity-generating retroelement protein Avd [Chloroflexota bacterium]MCI0649247.1 diversity-generating retroelement protein Avd [Chloroflexota bacterium]MCI0726546.1 diversity-generating retroelement protein Avd [Chloroflexota bacterium]